MKAKRPTADTERSLRHRVEQLEAELQTTRIQILALMPIGLEAALSSYHDCTSIGEMTAWSYATAEIVSESAVVRRPEDVGEPGSRMKRAYCPLCGGSAQKIYGAEGFAFPEGLRRHLLGEKNARQCFIFGAAVALARETVHRLVDGPQLQSDKRQ